MFPGIDPRLVKQAMKKMGLKQEEIDAEMVVIRTKDKKIIIENPEVVKVNFVGGESFQISGNVREEEIKEEPEFSEEDIKIVMEQAGCSREEALDAIKENKGDLAKAILMLKK